MCKCNMSSSLSTFVGLKLQRAQKTQNEWCLLKLACLNFSKIYSNTTSQNYFTCKTSKYIHKSDTATLLLHLFVFDFFPLGLEPYHNGQNYVKQPQRTKQKQ